MVRCAVLCEGEWSEWCRSHGETRSGSRVGEEGTRASNSTRRQGSATRNGTGNSSRRVRVSEPLDLDARLYLSPFTLPFPLPQGQALGMALRLCWAGALMPRILPGSDSHLAGMRRLRMRCVLPLRSCRLSNKSTRDDPRCFTARRFEQDSSASLLQFAPSAETYKSPRSCPRRPVGGADPHSVPQCVPAGHKRVGISSASLKSGIWLLLVCVPFTGLIQPQRPEDAPARDRIRQDPDSVLVWRHGWVMYRSTACQLVKTRYISSLQQPTMSCRC